MIIIISSLKSDSSSNLDRDNYAVTTTAAAYSPVTAATTNVATDTQKTTSNNETENIETTLITEKDIWGLWEYHTSKDSGTVRFYSDNKTITFYSDNTMTGSIIECSVFGATDGVQYEVVYDIIDGKWKYLEHEQVIKGSFTHKNEVYHNIEEIDFVFPVEIVGEDVIIHYGKNEGQIMTKVE